MFMFSELDIQYCRAFPSKFLYTANKTEKYLSYFTPIVFPSA